MLARLRPYFPVLTLLLLIASVSAVDPVFLQAESLMQTAQDSATLFLMALGISFVIYIGGIDLSAQSIASMSTVVLVALLPGLGVFAIVVTVLFAAVLGLGSGAIHTYLRIPSFISTLAIGGVAYSLGQQFSGQRSSYIPAELKSEHLVWIVGRSAGVPNEILIAAVVFVAALWLERRSSFGRRLKAIGAGEPAAAAAGLSVRRHKVAAYALSAALAACCGVMLATRLSGASPTMADQFLLPAIVAVLVGGTPLTGGVGGVYNTLCGALIVAVVQTSMTYFEIPAQGQQIFFGLVLIGTVALTIDRSRVGVVK